MGEIFPDKIMDTYAKFFIAIIGLAIMKFMLAQNDFKTFCLLYGMMWGGFIIIKLITFVIPVINVMHHKIVTMQIAKLYLFSTFLNTPIPFILYWVYLKSFNTVKQK